MQGRFKLGRGQRPPRSKRALQLQLQAIESCPKHNNLQQLDPLGKRILCKCGYHTACPNYLTRHYDVKGGGGG